MYDKSKAESDRLEIRYKIWRIYILAGAITPLMQNI